MSKVQSPKSTSSARALRDIPGVLMSQQQRADFGLGTLDFGLTVSDLRKSFRSPTGEKIEVLRGVSFSIEQGEAAAVVGSSGAGKSTLLHLLAGIEDADHGSIRARQFSVESATQHELAGFRNRHVGLVFQFHHLLKDLTALENVCLPLMMQRQPRGAALSTARRALESHGLGDRCSHLVSDLSGGEQQRVAVCRALVGGPRLVLADEPTGNLDAVVGEQIIAALMTYAHEMPAIVIIVTHNPAFAAKCDRQFILEEGRLREIQRGYANC